MKLMRPVNVYRPHLYDEMEGRLSHFNQHNAQHQHAQTEPAFAVEALLEQNHAHDDGDDDAEAAPQGIGHRQGDAFDGERQTGKCAKHTQNGSAAEQHAFKAVGHFQ